MGAAETTQEWADSVRRSVDPGSSKLILVDLAVQTAEMVDRADDRVFLAASARLLQLVTAVERDGGGVGAGGSGVGEAWERLVGADPDPVDDSEDAGA